MPELPLVMGILNATPDSFSDGGKFFRLDHALNRVQEMVNEGTDFIDVGGESARPGAEPVTVQQELDRVIPVIESIYDRFDVQISVDTRKYEVAREAVSAGACLVNDISAGRDERMPSLIAEKKCSVVLMHMLGEPATMQNGPTYPRGVVYEVVDFLGERAKRFIEAGVPKKNVWVDPGIGFGKTLGHNLELLREIRRFREIAGRIVIGTSRKSFLSEILGERGLPFSLRREGTLVSNLWAYQHGASVFRVHDPGAFRRLLKTWEALSDDSESRSYLPS